MTASLSSSTSSRRLFLLTCSILCFTLAPSTVLGGAVTSFRTPDDPEPTPPAGGWYWGEIDANIDWCERNYSTTSYIAEFWNALSSIPIFIFAVVGYFAGKRYSMAETRFSLAFFMIMLVGLGSTMFHATLRRYAQSMDELPMMWTSIVLFYNAVDHKPNTNDPSWIHPSTSSRPSTRPPPRQAAKTLPFLPNHPFFNRGVLKVGLIIAGIVLTTIYFHFPGLFIVFFVGYSTFLMSFIFITAFHLFFSSRAERKNRQNAAAYEQLAMQDVNGNNPQNLEEGSAGINGNGGVQLINDNPNSPFTLSNRPYSANLGKLFWLAIIGYFGGFVFWMYENTYCTTLPPYMQLHAVWHLMAGFGSFCTVQSQLAWRAEILGGRTQIDYELGGNVLPIVVVKYTQSE